MEGLSRGGYGGFAPPSVAQLDYAQRVDATYRKVMAEVAAFFK
jgi:hypothetical protein